MLPDAATRSPIRWLRLLASGLLATTLGACSTAGYLLQAANGEARLLARRRPLGQVIADPATPVVLRAQLETVRAARDFAVQALGLPDNESYRSYADIGRPYVVWNVIAAPQFSVEPRRWCFPFAGCVAYRGYFREVNARRYAAGLARRGDDVLVAGVSAYSTLGHFDDPVVSSMLRQGEITLVATLFHELAHQLLYVRGDTEFNEAFAMTVEQEGLARWLAQQGRPAELAGFLAQRRRQAQTAAIFGAARGDLARLYASGLPAGELGERKRVRLQQAGSELQEHARAAGVASGYEAWISAGLNNAHLAAVSSYQGCIPGFQRLLVAAGGDLRRFHAAARALASSPAAARRAFCADAAVSADAGAASATSPRPGPASAPPPDVSGS
jgi:predicted aminopeptidase